MVPEWCYATSPGRQRLSFSAIKPRAEGAYRSAGCFATLRVVSYLLKLCSSYRQSRTTGNTNGLLARCLALLLLAPIAGAATEVGQSREAAAVCPQIRPASAGSRTPNPITIENSKRGTPAWVITNPAGYHEIEGYASAASVNRGGRISFFVNTSAPFYSLEVFRLGWYNRLGARRMTFPVTLPGVAQPIPRPAADTGIVECRWTRSYVLTLRNPQDPTDWASGVYVVKLTALPSGKQSYIIFVVRDDDRPSDLLFQSSVATEQAYNPWGGKSLYQGRIGGPYSVTKAVKVSFNRPYYFGSGAGNFFQLGEYTTLRFLEREGYNVSYSTDVDTHENFAALLRHRAFLSVGHDEYWSYEMRRNVTLARDSGINLGFFSSNTMYWQIRFEPGYDGTPDRTVVCYKVGAHLVDGIVPDDDPVSQNQATYYLLTTTWRAPHVTLPGAPEERVIGEQSGFKAEAPGTPRITNHDVIVVNTSNWVFNQTGLRDGDHLAGLLGGETETRQGHEPAGTVSLSKSPLTPTGGGTVQEMTLYQATSCAIVFATGDWVWASGLDYWYNDFIHIPYVTNAAAQQMTRNVLNRLIIPPGSN